MAHIPDQHRLAIITGAAGGMGSAAARLLADQGWSLILCDIEHARIEAVARALSAAVRGIEIVAADMAGQAFPDALLGLVGERTIGALLHTAGLSPTMGDAARIFAVNYDATVRLVDAVRPRMAVGGCAVLIASSSAYFVRSPEMELALSALTPGQDSSSLLKLAPVPELAYPLSKLAVIRLVEREAAAFGARGARIVSISPGLIDTAMGRAEQAAHPQMTALLAKTPLGRFGTADEVASVAVFLCSSAATFISGCDVKVDGGMLAAAAMPRPEPAIRQQGEADSAPIAASPAARVPGWDVFSDAVRDLPIRMLEKLPPAMREDAQLRQEVGRLALSALTSGALDALASDGDHPAFVPQIGQALNIGQPNADTIYRMARITPGGSYRIRGLLGNVAIVKIGESGPSPFELAPGTAPRRGPRAHHDFNALKVDVNGRYDVLLSPLRPVNYSGDWWPLQPDTNKLLLRMVSAIWGAELDPTFAIERVDIPASRPRPDAAVLERRLRLIPRMAGFMGPMFVAHVEKLRQEGFINRFKVLDVSQVGGLVGQFYYEGPYELDDDEALLVEVKEPALCPYRSLILTNELYETTDWYNNHSSLNGSQAPVDDDGVLRIVISGRDPGVPNWLDTAGHSRGLIQGRWTDCDLQPIPSLRKLRLDEVRQALPSGTPFVTPAQREREVRARRAAYQQRPLW